MFPSIASYLKYVPRRAVTSAGMIRIKSRLTLLDLLPFGLSQRSSEFVRILELDCGYSSRLDDPSWTISRSLPFAELTSARHCGRRSEVVVGALMKGPSRNFGDNESQVPFFSPRER
jgi:hypothetical protein